MGLNFPASPIDGQIHIPAISGPIWIYKSSVAAWTRNAGTALRWNRIVNPAMQISQENNFNTGGGGLSGSYYITDQWNTRWSTTTAPTVQVMMWAAADGIRNIYVNVAYGILSGANDYIVITQHIEGNRVADLQWGTANAKTIVLRFRHLASRSGLYSVRIANSAQNRSFVATFYSDYVIRDEVISIPGDTTGTWLTDTGIGIQLDFCAAIGSTYHGVTGWQNGNIYAIPGQFSGHASSYWQFYLANVGLYLDPYKTGVAPEFEMPHYEDDLMECQRYWYRIYGARGVSGATTSRLQAVHPVPMRASPSLTLVGTTLRAYDGTTAPNTTAVTNVSSDAQNAVFTVTHPTLVVGRRGGILVDSVDTNYIAVSARM